MEQVSSPMSTAKVDVKWSSVAKKSIFLMTVGLQLGLTWYLPGPQWKEKARAAASPHLAFFTLRAPKCSVSLRPILASFSVSVPISVRRVPSESSAWGYFAVSIWLETQLCMTLVPYWFSPMLENWARC